MTVATIVVRVTCDRQPRRRGDPDASSSQEQVHPPGSDCRLGIRQIGAADHSHLESGTPLVTVKHPITPGLMTRLWLVA
jgi:hypothetical protein